MTINNPKCPSVLILDVLRDAECQFLSVRDIIKAIFEKHSVNYAPDTVVKYIDVLKHTTCVAEKFERRGEKIITTKVFTIITNNIH